jgi:hypothetical protein
MVMKKHRNSIAFVCSTLAIALGLTACQDPIPTRTLTSDEKVADLYWIYSQFGENYAPLEWKEKLYSFDFEKLKLDYLDRAKATKTNDEFYDLMFNFVAQFKDAHTSAALTASSLPNRASVAFLGFNGFRKGEKFVVKSLLPTISPTSAFPIKVGDVITMVNGKSVKDVVISEQLQYRNFGSDEANQTALMNTIFTRVSTINGLPTDANAVITIEKDDPAAQDQAMVVANAIADPILKAAALSELAKNPKKKLVNYTIPWVVKDLNKFKKEQAAAAAPSASPNPAAPGTGKTPAENAENFLMVDGNDANLLKFNFIGFNGRVIMPFDLVQSVTESVRKRISDSFKLIDTYAAWSVADAPDAAPKTAKDNLADKRAVMKNAIFIEGSNNYPAYVASRDVLDKDGNRTGKKTLIGYLYIDSFEPAETDENIVIAEVKNTLSSFQTLGVKDLIIDTINNGGGSLTLGMKIAQLLSNKQIEMPKMQVRLSDTWLDQFEAETLKADSDAEAEDARRTLNTLRDQQAAGQRLSTPLAADDLLAPFQIQPNDDLDQPF